MQSAASFPSSGAPPAAPNPFLAMSPAPRVSGPPSPGEQDCAMLQWAAAHRLPALPDQLGFWALHARPGTRGARLGPSGREQRHRTCRAISVATWATPHLLQPLRLGQVGFCHCSFLALGGGPPALLGPLALLGALLRPLLPAPRGAESALHRTVPSGPTRHFKAAAAPPLRPSKHASLGRRSKPRFRA